MNMKKDSINSENVSQIPCIVKDGVNKLVSAILFDDEGKEVEKASGSSILEALNKFNENHRYG